MPQRFQVSVAKDTFTFCSGHFITYDGNHCEPLHGHNYKVKVELDGPLDQNHYVFDFIALTEMTGQICKSLDHRMLLPARSKLIQVKTIREQVEARFENKIWSFPLDNCVLLPVENTTTELIAQFITASLKKRLKDEKQFTPARIRVIVEESPGHEASFEE